jgi:hypothetical protein
MTRPVAHPLPRGGFQLRGIFLAPAMNIPRSQKIPHDNWERAAGLQEATE